MNPAINTIWFGVFYKAKEINHSAVSYLVDDKTWFDVRAPVEDIVVNQYRDNVYYEVNYYVPPT